MLRLSQKIVTLLFPTQCLGCETEILPTASSRNSPQTSDLPPDQNDFRTSFDFHWCDQCWRKLTTLAPHRCPKCSANLFRNNPFPDRCALCFGIDLRFEQAVSIGNYRGLLQELVIRMKNNHDEQLAIQMANLLAYEVLQSDFLDDLNLVVPVPTHWWRRVKRGFHATEVISETVAASCDIPYAGQIMNCVRGTKKQGTLSTPGRFKNVRNAFELRPSLSVSGLNILLLDDVMTSGATVSELSRVLLNAGAAKVYVGVIARGARVS